MAKEQKNIPLAPYLRVPRELPGLDVEHRVAFWRLIGKEGLYLKRQEILEGVDKWGVKFLPVKRSWGVKTPLIPHSETSRTYDLLSLNTSAHGATLFWKRGEGREPWSKILGYHAYKHGPRSLPVRNVFGLSPESEEQIMAQPEIWEAGFKAGIAAAARKTTVSAKAQAETRLERILRLQREEQAKRTPPAPRLSAEEKQARAEAALHKKEAVAAKREAAAAAKLLREEAIARRKAEAAAKKAEAEAKRVARAEAAARKAAEREAKAAMAAAKKAEAVAKKEAAAARKREREEAAARRKAEVAARKAEREAKASAKKAEAEAKKKVRAEAAKERQAKAKARAKVREEKAKTPRKTAAQKRTEAEAEKAKGRIAEEKAREDASKKKVAEKVVKKVVKKVAEKKVQTEKVAEDQAKVEASYRQKVIREVETAESNVAEILKNPTLNRENLKYLGNVEGIRYSLSGMASGIIAKHGKNSPEAKAALERTDRFEKDLKEAGEKMLGKHVVENFVKDAFHGMSDAKTLNKVHFEGIDYLFEKELDSSVIKTLVSISSEDKLPEKILKSTKRVVFTKQTNKKDDYWKVEYNNPAHVSAATGGDGDVVVYNGKSIDFGSITHEMGHNLAYRLYGTTNPSKNKQYIEAMNSGEAPVSDYAKNSRSEDFAESVRYYFGFRSQMKEKSPLRFAVIDRIFNPK